MRVLFIITQIVCKKVITKSYTVLKGLLVNIMKEHRQYIEFVLLHWCKSMQNLEHIIHVVNLIYFIRLRIYTHAHTTSGRKQPLTKHESASTRYKEAWLKFTFY